MIQVETAIRAWVEPEKRRRRKRKRDPPWRPQPYGQRVLVFDTETTTDHAQRLLFAFFRIYERDRFVREGIVAAAVLDHEAMTAINDYATKHRLPVYSRERFIEEVFFPELCELGTLCVGFNLPFDLARIACDAGCGRGKNRRKFRLKLSRRVKVHDLHVEPASGHAAFIGFVPKRKLYRRESAFFKGRFLDLSTLTRALTGASKTLATACKLFRTHTRKMGIEELGKVDRRTLTYGRQDVRVTWALYRKLRDEYAKHPFATFENELHKPEGAVYMGHLYSGASLAKAYLRLLGFRPLLEAQPEFDRHYLGYGAASYFGGRSEVGVRKRDVPVTVVDFTSMYPTIFIRQDLQALIGGELSVEDIPAAEIERLLAELTPERLYDPAIWPLLNCLALVEPGGAVLPSRMRTLSSVELSHASRTDGKVPYSIAVAPLHAPEPRWYTLADVIASNLLGDKAPRVIRAFRIVANGTRVERAIAFRSDVELSTNDPILRTLVEERQRVRAAVDADEGRAHLATALKVTVNSVYGMFAEVNVSPRKANGLLPGHVYSDIDYPCPNVHDERPGAFSNPIIASLITGGARLMLALLEYEVRKAGGTFASCDTDSLHIVCGERCPQDVPCLTGRQVEAIRDKFDALNPYCNVKHLLKFEHDDLPDLRCFAISAKRYVLYRIRPGRRIQIVKASESGLGAILGRTRNENTANLARRIWLAILMKELKGINKRQRCRARLLIDFAVPLRRKFPISQPSILQRLTAYNRGRSYDFTVKPGGFVQTVTPATVTGGSDVLPIAPFELDLSKSKRLTWIDFNHPPKTVRLDWSGTGYADAVPVMRMNEYIEQYRRHPEAKAAAQDGNPAGPDTLGVLGPLEVRSGPVRRIGKEIDRLDQDEGASLEGGAPVEYDRERRSITADVEYLARFPQQRTAREIGISERRWRDIVKGEAKPRGATAESIECVAAAHRFSSRR